MPCRWIDVCPLRAYEKKGLISERWKKEYCKTDDNWKNCRRYQMTEKCEHHPDNMMPDGTINKSLN